jgi:ribosomal protein S18 acetylase RimI-like enzyme
MKINIRPMTYKDKPSIVAMLGNTPEFKPSEVAVAEEVIDCYLKDPAGAGYKILIAEDDSSVVGYICYGPTPMTEGTWDIYWIVVTPEKHRQGIGTTLLKLVEKNVRKVKGRLAIIETSSTPAYEATRRFYVSHGYEIIARLPDFYEPGDDKIVLQKRLR